MEIQELKSRIFEIKIKHCIGLTEERINGRKNKSINFFKNLKKRERIEK